MSAACNGAVNVYSSFANGPAGWSLTCGTSEATPEFAAIVALADQVAGHPLGLLNPDPLRAAGRSTRPAWSTSPPATTPSPSTRARPARAPTRARDSQGTAATLHTVTGYQAAKGYNLVTGVGTVNASQFVYELAGVPVP